MDEFDQPMPRCPQCLIPLDVEGPDELPYLECAQCGTVFFV
jgi:hypothetical protein